MHLALSLSMPAGSRSRLVLAASGDLLCFEEIRHRPEHQVWTIVDSGDDGDGNWYAVPGIHHVNALGYVTTVKAWDDPAQQAIYFLDDVS